MRGEYDLGDVVERFAFDGTTWTATRTDAASGAVRSRLQLTVGAETRLHVEAGGWLLRGGTVGGEVLWRRGDEEREAVADGIWLPSPAYALAVLARRPLDVGSAQRLRLVAVTEPVLATRLVDVQWERTGEDAYAVADLATGERTPVLVRDGLVETPAAALTRL